MNPDLNRPQQLGWKYVEEEQAMAASVQQTLDGLPLDMPKRWKSYTRKFKQAFVILILIHTSAPTLVAAVYANTLDRSIELARLASHAQMFMGMVMRLTSVYPLICAYYHSIYHYKFVRLLTSIIMFQYRHHPSLGALWDLCNIFGSNLSTFPDINYIWAVPV